MTMRTRGKTSVTARTETERKRRLEETTAPATGIRKKQGSNNKDDGGKDDKRDRRRKGKGMTGREKVIGRHDRYAEEND